MDAFIKNLKIVYYSGLIIPLLFLGVFSIFAIPDTDIRHDNLDAVFRYLIPVFAVLFIPLGFIMFRNGLKKIKQEKDIDTILFTYRKYFVFRISYIVGVEMFSIVVLFYTLNPLYILYFLFILLILFFIYPTDKRVLKALGVSSEDIQNHEIREKEPKRSFSKKHRFIYVLITLLLLIWNFYFLWDFFHDKNKFPDVEVDRGTIQDSVYHNKYLDWTFIIPKNYRVIPDSVLDRNYKQGSKYLGSDQKRNNKEVRLLNITNGTTDLRSTLSPRALYPQLKTEKDYLIMISESFQNINADNVTIEIIEQGEVPIDSLEFNYLEFVFKGKRQLGSIIFTRFNKDYILDISILYLDTEQGKELLQRLNSSEINWK